MSIEGVDQESAVKDQPGNDFRTRDRLPGFVRPEVVEKGLQVFAHGQFDIRAGVRRGKITNVRARRAQEDKLEDKISDFRLGGRRPFIAEAAENGRGEGKRESARPAALEES
jgi:hypothetical protein